MISGLHGINYDEKLKELKLTSLETRRKRFDMIQVYKILHKVDNVEESTWFTRTGLSHNRVTRQAVDPFHLIKQHTRSDIYSNFFANCVIDHWNALPLDVKNAKSVKHFKILYDNL